VLQQTHQLQLRPAHCHQQPVLLQTAAAMCHMADLLKLQNRAGPKVPAAHGPKAGASTEQHMYKQRTLTAAVRQSLKMRH
jgi:hypothetical protein